MSMKALINDILKDARKWDRRYLGVTLHAIRRFQTEGDAEQLIDWFLSEQAAGDFNLANPYSKDLLLAELLPSLLGHVAQGSDDPEGAIGMACALATFLRPGWECAEGHIDFDLGKAKKAIRNALAGFDFIGRFEPVTYQNEFYGNGRSRGPLVCFHCHCLVWTTASYSKLERLRRSLRHRFGGNVDDSEGVNFSRLKSAKDVGKGAAYLSKMPALGKRTEDRGAGRSVQRSRMISYRSYNAMFNELRKHDMYTFWLSGGDGSKFLRDARKRLKNQASTGKRRSVGMGRPGEPKYRRNRPR